MFASRLRDVAQDLTAAAESLERLSEQWGTQVTADKAVDTDYVRGACLYMEMIEFAGGLLERAQLLATLQNGAATA